MRTKLIFIVAVFFSWVSSAAAVPDFSLVGFGASATGGTTEVTVNNYNDLKTAAEAGGKIVKVNGTINNGKYGGIIKVASNTSIIGVGTNAFFNGVGIYIKNVNNIVIRNIKMTMMGVTYRGEMDGSSIDSSSIYDPDGDEGRPQIKVNDGDCIHIEGTSYDIWVDHSEFYAEDPYIQTNQDLYDGLLDVKSSSHNITVSWNYFHDHHKTSLIGSSDTDNKDRKMTFHHNYYYNVKERLPAYRFGTGHIFNNYYKHCAKAIETRMGACLYVESSVFDDLDKSIFWSNGASTGYAKSVNNSFLNGTPGAESGVTSSYDSKCSAFLKPTYAYNSVMTPVGDVATIVTTYAGVGKLDVGVVSSSSTEPSSSSVTSSSSVAEGTAILTKHGTGGSSQTVEKGSAIVSFYYTWTNATGATATGLPEGITATVNTSESTITIKGTVTAPAGDYNFTVTTIGATTNAIKTGKITVEGFSSIASINVTESRLQVVPAMLWGNAVVSLDVNYAGSATMRLVDVSGKVSLLRNLKVQPGANAFNISRDALTSGVYFLKMNTAYEQLQQKVIVP